MSDNQSDRAVGHTKGYRKGPGVRQKPRRPRLAEQQLHLAIPQPDYIVYPWCVGRYDPTPYIAAGFYYASHYNKWSDTALYAGCSLPLRKHSALSRQADFFLAFCAESSFFSPV
jgi:hypothetical protein